MIECGMTSRRHSVPVHGKIYAMLNKGVDYDPKKMVSDIKRPAVYLQAA